MPFKSDKIKIEGTPHDKRRKLTEDQKKDIFENKHGLSQRKLAEAYGVSRRTIQFILDPKKLEENKKRREERGGWKQYYKKENNTAAVRKTRRHKQILFNAGEINLPKKKTK
jgi:hypothetical protein